MNKKEKRKELEILLVKTIEEILNKQNKDATKKIKKTIASSSEVIAKKFYKAIKSITEIKNDTPKKVIKKSIKAVVSKAKLKIKK